MIDNAILMDDELSNYVYCDLSSDPSTHWIMPKFKSTYDDVKYSARTVPDVLDYQYEIWTEHNQGSVGSCYMHSTIHWVEWFYWKHTGSTITFTHDQIWDICGDYKGVTQAKRKKAGSSSSSVDKLIGGGWESVPSVLNYNKKTSQHYWSGTSQIEACTKLNTLWNSFNIGEKVGYKNIGSNIDAWKIKQALVFNGPCFLAFNTGNGGHAVLAIGYDSKYLYVRNSWGKANPYGILWTNLTSNKRFWEISWYENQLGGLN